MKTTVPIVILFLAGLPSSTTGDEHNEQKAGLNAKQVVTHYKILEKHLKVHTDWPKEVFKSYPQMIMLKEAVNSMKDVTSIINNRPQAFKNQDIVYKIIKRDRFYIIALLHGQPAPTPLDEEVISKAYVIAKGTNRVFCWINW